MDTEDLALGFVQADDIKKALFETKDLTLRQKQVLILRFGLEDGCPRSLQEVGTEFNITKEGVRQIEIKALGKLRLELRLRAWTQQAISA